MTTPVKAVFEFPEEVCLSVVKFVVLDTGIRASVKQELVIKTQVPGKLTLPLEIPLG